MKMPFLRLLPVWIGMGVMLVAVPVLGQPPSFTGDWDLSMQVYLVEASGPCDYSGTLNITSQVGAAIQGTAELDLVSGPPECPAMMTANLDGSWTDGLLIGTLDGGEMYGAADFEGTLTPLMTGATPAVPGKAAPGTSYSGPFTVTAGQYVQTVNGSWSAVARGAATLAIPVLGPVGLTALILLLLTGGAWLLTRGRLV